MKFKLEKNQFEETKEVRISKKRRLKRNSNKPLNTIVFDKDGQVIRDKMAILE